MICFPNCKINLGLYVTRKRDDGYHDIETVFYGVRHSHSGGGSVEASTKVTGSLLDVLEVVPATETNIHLSGLAVAGNSESNLVWKAYQLLKAKFPDKVTPLDIYLHKVIPMGAGLGGGSADGSFMLRLLNDYFDLGLTKEELLPLALRLGSDCPFFIHNTPQFASGRGEQMSDIAIDLSPYSIQIICPQVHVSTGTAFAMMQPKAAPFNLRTLGNLPVEQWRDNISNDFEEPVFQQHPVLADIKELLYKQGALYAAMSGSGSAIFGIFPKSMGAGITANVPFSTFYLP